MRKCEETSPVHAFGAGDGARPLRRDPEISYTSNPVSHIQWGRQYYSSQFLNNSRFKLLTRYPEDYVDTGEGGGDEGAGPHTYKNVSLRYMPQDSSTLSKTKTYPWLNFDDAWLMQDSYTYNHDLATFCMAMANNPLYDPDLKSLCVLDTGVHFSPDRILIHRFLVKGCGLF